MSRSTKSLLPTPLMKYRVPLPSYTGTNDADDNAMDSLNQRIMEDTLAPISSIYIDIQMLRDIYLGTLLKLCTSTEYNYILANLVNYERRILELPILEYFPEVTSVSMDDIINYISDPSHTLELCMTAPTTSLFTEFLSMIHYTVQHNKVASGESSPWLTICINFYPLPASEYVKTIYSRLVESIYPRCKLQYTVIKLSQLPASVLYTSSNKPRYSMYFIYDFIDFLSSSSTSLTKYRDDLCYFNTPIITTRRIDPDIYSDTLDKDVRYDQMFKNTEALFQVTSKFSYLDLKFTRSST